MNSSFSKGSADDSVKQIADVSRPVEFPAGAIIFRAGEPATKVYWVATGEVSIEICAPGVGSRRILTIGDGDLLAWSPLLGLKQLTATARALTPMTAIEVNASQVLAMCERHPRLGYELLRQVARAMSTRLNATRLQLIDVYGSQMPNSDN